MDPFIEDESIRFNTAEICPYDIYISVFMAGDICGRDPFVTEVSDFNDFFRFLGNEDVTRYRKENDPHTEDPKNCCFHTCDLPR